MLTAEKVLFFFFAFLTLASAVLAVSRRQPVFGVLFLFVLGLSVAALFALKNAYFLALIQIIVYVGAVLVLFVFVIAMMNLKGEELVFGKFAKWRLVVLLPALILAVVFSASLLAEPSLYSQKFVFFPAELVGEKLYKDLVFQFEFLSVFLLTAIVVTIYVGKRFGKGKSEGKGGNMER